ncbi:lycopene cyclase family protein [Amycolatopsis pigmentata]|uniref:Lycopene cyclase family protein n=1 Tax=Amycolatopsis pigmentata TaxID=450801 RepID=A0ABW5FM41_9PSEU
MRDVLVAGAGPAGWALASACARLGLRTALVAPAPRERWPATYGVWRDELPDLPGYAIAAAPAATLAVGTSGHRLDREYLILDNDGLRRHLTHPAVEVLTGRAEGLQARVVVNATGARARPGGAEQTAYGLVLPAEDAAPLVPANTALLMDWSHPVRDPSFLYAVPRSDGVLVEETSLARAPGLPPDILAARLRHRLSAAGIRIPASPREELVRIPLDAPRAPAPAFGAAAGLIHPATGYSLATSLRLAPPVARALHEGLRDGPAEAIRAASHEIWPPAARAVHRLRLHGFRALLTMSPQTTAEFFELFFRLPAELQRAMTSGRTDLAGTVAAMTELFREAPWRVRIALMALG